MKKLILSLLFAFSVFFAQAQTADELFTSKEYVKAVDAYTSIIKEEPQNLQALRRLAFCYMKIKGTDHLAMTWFEAALKVDPKDMASNYYLGVMIKEALQRELTPDQRKNAISRAKKHLQVAADQGSDDAKTELKTL